MLTLGLAPDCSIAHAGSDEFFEKRIRPLLVEKCFKCHSAESEKLKGGLRLDSREAMLKGGDTGPAVVPGEPARSLLIKAVSYEHTDLQMPPKAKLPARELSDLASWVTSGAPWPAAKPAMGAGASAKKDGFDLQKRRASHWAWQPVRATALPKVKQRDWPATTVDQFVLAKLEAANLKPATSAGARALIRRLSFDLVGLPPTPAQAEAFAASTGGTDRPNKPYESVVDELLASPAFGERWARHWLDLVRYAETRGHEFEPIIPNAWQYRDYVIRALNADVPYDRFVTEHIAGDLVPQPRLNPGNGANESLLGTGFWFLGEEVHSPVDIRQDECDRLDNRVDVMTKTFLGLTVSCARCHDHKFDAISQRDYYALVGFLISSNYRQARFETIEHHRAIAHELDKLRTSESPRLMTELAVALRPAAESAAQNLLAVRRAAPAEREAGNTWPRELSAAKSDRAHPLHAFAALPPGADDPSRFRSEAATFLQSFTNRPGAASGPEDGIIADFTRVAAQDWFQDGFSFGLRPARAGELRFGADGVQPLLGVLTHAGAWRDEAWKQLKVTATERDDAKLGQWDRSEQTLRTPEFTLTGGRLWYLVKGPGRAYSPVDSHLIVHGPLHGATLKEWKTGATEWQWVEHRLDAYKGHRAHVEFSPVGTNDLAIAMVLQQESQPSAPGTNPLVASLLADAACDSATALANGLQALFLRALGRMESSALATDPEAAALAPFADLLVRNVHSFCPVGSARRTRLDAALRPFATRQAELAKSIKPNSATAPAIMDGNGVSEFLLVRGQPRTPAAPVPRRFLEAIAGARQPDYGAGSGRLQLAQQITDPSNPLTARVIVNRVWHHLFGRGIVPTVDNFGALGQAPSHPELLDHLADRFVTVHRWSLKQLIRELVLSRAYQMSSEPVDARAEAADPANALLHRANLRRLEAEVIRDSILAVSGRLDPKQGGPSVPVHLTAFMEGRGRPAQSGPPDGDGRRSIYIAVRRNFLSPMMLAFDAPIPFTTIGRRNVSNVPAQALILMNDPFVVQQAQVWAKRVLAAPTASTAERVRGIYLAAFARLPTVSELGDSLAFVEAQSRSYEPGASGEQKAWADLCHVMFNAKEFIFLN